MDPFNHPAKLPNNLECERRCLVDTFKCYICMDKLNDARLCPHCSKLCCYSCIRRWITTQRSQCPHCRAILHLDQLVNLRWIDDVTKHLEAFNVTQSGADNAEASSSASSLAVEAASMSNAVLDNDLCSVHNERLTVYCITCSRSICHQCALFDTGHAQHEFRPLKDIYEANMAKIRVELDKLKRRHIELIAIVQDVERNLDTVKQAKDARVREVRTAVELMIARLEGQMKSKCNVLIAQREQLTKETELMETMLDTVQNEIRTRSRAALIDRTSPLTAIFNEIHKKPMTSFVSAPVPAEFVSEIVPGYDCAHFTVSNFSELRRRANPVFSKPLRASGVSWRLKVYPDGNGTVRGTYLSVFLELYEVPNGGVASSASMNVTAASSALLTAAGSSAGSGESSPLSGGASAGATSSYEPSKYEYRVEMINQMGAGGTTDQQTQQPAQRSNVVREFASEFELGECWGYNRFFRLDQLRSEGFLHPETDCIKLTFQVRSPTYFQKSRDLANHAAHLQHANVRLEAENKRLRAELQQWERSGTSAAVTSAGSAASTSVVGSRGGVRQTAATPGGEQRRRGVARVASSAARQVRQSGEAGVVGDGEGEEEEEEEARQVEENEAQTRARTLQRENQEEGEAADEEEEEINLLGEENDDEVEEEGEGEERDHGANLDEHDLQEEQEENDNENEHDEETENEDEEEQHEGEQEAQENNECDDDNDNNDDNDADDENEHENDASGEVTRSSRVRTDIEVEEEEVEEEEDGEPENIQLLDALSPPPPASISNVSANTNETAKSSERSTNSSLEHHQQGRDEYGSSPPPPPLPSRTHRASQQTQRNRNCYEMIFNNLPAPFPPQHLPHSSADLAPPRLASTSQPHSHSLASRLLHQSDGNSASAFSSAYMSLLNVMQTSSSPRNLNVRKNQSSTSNQSQSHTQSSQQSVSICNNLLDAPTLLSHHSSLCSSALPRRRNHAHTQASTHSSSSSSAAAAANHLFREEAPDGEDQGDADSHTHQHVQRSGVSRPSPHIGGESCSTSLSSSSETAGLTNTLQSLELSGSSLNATSVTNSTMPGNSEASSLNNSELATCLNYIQLRRRLFGGEEIADSNLPSGSSSSSATAAAGTETARATTNHATSGRNDANSSSDPIFMLPQVGGGGREDDMDLDESADDNEEEDGDSNKEGCEAVDNNDNDEKDSEDLDIHVENDHEEARARERSRVTVAAEELQRESGSASAARGGAGARDGGDNIDFFDSLRMIDKRDAANGSSSGFRPILPRRDQEVADMDYVEDVFGVFRARNENDTESPRSKEKSKRISRK